MITQKLNKEFGGLMNCKQLAENISYYCLTEGELPPDILHIADLVLLNRQRLPIRQALTSLLIGRAMRNIKFHNEIKGVIT